MSTQAEAEQLHRTLLERWNERDDRGYAELFTDDGSLVGFDGTSVDGAEAIHEHLHEIFTDHQPATYVRKVREVRDVAPGVVLVRAIVGMVPPDQSDINPAANAVQALVAVDTQRGWRIAHFHNTPTAFHGRPEAVDALSAELRAELG